MTAGGHTGPGPAGASPPRQPSVPAVSRGTARPVLFAWLFLSIVTGLPYLRAALAPPPGRAFVGTFHWINDVYNYLSFVQQAEDGRFLFEDKLVTQRHTPALINLEWWVVGRVSDALGQRPFLAYRILALVAGLMLLAAVDRWLRHGGLPDGHRLPSLLLVATGGGLGGLIFKFTDLPVGRCLDLAIGFYPFIEALSNPHWLIATALLLWALWAFASAGNWVGELRAVGLGTVLGLVRPYDLVMLVGIRTLVVLVSAPPRAWLRSLAPLAGLAPVSFYNWWIFFKNPDFALLSNPAYAQPIPPAVDFLFALGPPALLALTWLRNRTSLEGARETGLHFWVWILLGLLIAGLRPISFWAQFLIGLGVPLLALAGLGLSRYTPRATLGAAAALSSTAFVAVLIVLGPDPNWYVPATRLEAARALKQVCRPGDVVLAPPDIGLYSAGLTACRAYVAHEVSPDYGQREAEMVAFYSEADPRARGGFLDRNCVTHLVLPGSPGTTPREWLGESTSFREVARLGRTPSAVSIYSRDTPLGCRPRRD